MNDETRFDAVDDELSRRFRAGAGTDADPDAVLDGMRPQLQRARTRRRASIASGAVGLAVVTAVLVVVLGGGGGAGSNSVRVPPASGAPARTPPTVPTTVPSGGSVAPDTASGGIGGDAGATTPTPTPTVPDASSSPTTPLTAPPPQPAPPDSTYTSDGGSIVVHLADGVVSLVSSTPAAGYTAEIHDNGPTRVEVRFSNGQIEWRIRVDVVNGALVPEITKH